MRRRADSSEHIVLPGVAEALADTTRLIAGSVHSLSVDDSGYFGPGSVSWRIFSHASYGISGVAAVLIQALHPVAMAAVNEHSMFRTDAWRRAQTTADYVFTITFSARPVADAAAARVRRIHAGVSGTDPATGQIHRADEPALLLWVHAVHTDYALRGFEAFGGRLSPEEADRFVAEQVIAAGLVGLDPATVPATRAALSAWIAAVPGLGVTEPAAHFARLMLTARMPATMVPFWALHVAGAALLLPEAVRRAYGMARRLPGGRLGRALIAAAIAGIHHGYALFRPVRQARARMREVERGVRARRGAR